MPFLAALGIGLVAGRARSADNRFTETFSSPRPSWSVHAPRSVRLREQRRVVDRRQDRGYEFAKLESAARGARTVLSHRLPPARVIAELRLSLRLIANRNGARVFLRVVFPRHRDPRDGGPLTTLVEGERYSQAGKWQTLTGRITDLQIHRHIRQLRDQFSRPKIDSDGMYVDGVVVFVPCDPGVTQLGIADLRFGPVIPPKKSSVRHAGRRADADAGPKHAAEFRLDRLRVRGFPFLPRMTAYHGERPADLKSAGFNVGWIRRYDDRRTVAALRDAGLWITATPPGGPSAETAGQPARAIDPFDQGTAPILFWYLGTRIPAASRKEVVEWVDRVRNADRRFDRPIMGDVAGDERVYSRYLPLLGTTRRALHTSRSLGQYRDWLIQRRNLARPGSFLWTWIQTEPADIRPDAPIVVEPEQIRLQVYAAISAGCRGIGYWKTTPLDSKAAGAAERRLMIAQLNHELDLLAPWIATGTIAEPRPFTVQTPEGEKIGQRRLDFFTTDPEQRNALLRHREDRLKRRQAIGGELQAAVIRSEYGTLLLPMWYESNAQFTPGAMTAVRAQVLVPGASRSASAFEITTTRIRNLKPERVTGGIRLTLQRFDQTAAVIVTTNRRVIEQLKKRVREIAPHSAKVLVALAAEKYERVRRLNAELEKLDRRQIDAPQILRKAAMFVGNARYALEQDDYDAARLQSGNAMQLLRILQRAHWNDAARQLASGVCSPYAVCFQTLPEHWRLIARYAKSRTKTPGNALRSGNFEDIDTMIAEGWKHTQNAHPALRAVAELYPKGKQGSYSLRLVAAPRPGRDLPRLLEKPLVSVTSPPVTVRSGQIVKISGWVKVATPISGNLDGAVLYDNLAGPRGALRWNVEVDWKRFAILREVKRSGELRLSIQLKGIGEVRFDDVQVSVHTPPDENRHTTPRPAPARRGPLNLLDRFPALPSLPRFGTRR